MIKKIFFLCVCFSTYSYAQDTVVKKQDKVKTGWTFGALPVVAFNSDIGFQYGGLVNFYDYGKGINYPKYDHSIYMEFSKSTKGAGIRQIEVDSRKLIPGIRTQMEVALLTEKALHFYGFNGYQALYNPAFETDNDPSYISRMYYRVDRKMYRYKANFTGDIRNTKLKWYAGFEFTDIRLNTVDINKLNSDLPDNDKLPDTSLLYDKYVEWGIIKNHEKNGGRTTVLQTGLIYDTRDVEANPMKGMWTEALLLGAPGFLSDHSNYLRFVATHRQYFTLVPQVLSFVYRVSYQGKIAGNMPFYMLPFVYNTAPNKTRDGMGGHHTMRGVLRSRVVGEDYLYSNIETRWKFLRTVILNQNIYLALSAFVDGGMTTRPYQFDETLVPAEYKSSISHTNETIHASYGGGFRVVLNENFIVAVDAGRPFNPNDGESGVYIFLSWLF